MSAQKPNESIFKKIPDTRYIEPAIETNAAEFEKVVRSRRSTRVYSDESVPESVMRKCLELATLAPNSSNLQCWEFYWVREETGTGQALPWAASGSDGSRVDCMCGSTGYVETQLADDVGTSGQ